MPRNFTLALDADPPQPPTDRLLVEVLSPAEWPFLYPWNLRLPASPAAIVIHDLHEAFVNHQTPGTRLVTTQATYLWLEWEKLIGKHDVEILASANSEALTEHAPEILAKRGPFGDVITHPAARDGLGLQARRPVTGFTPLPSMVAGPAGRAYVSQLAHAFRVADPAERLAMCVGVLNSGRGPAALLATASACMEVNDLDAAGRDLDDVVREAPEWAAAHFERGKLCLRREDMEGASQAFAAAAERLPRFASAWANLGAALGELDRPQEALDAFVHARDCDADNPQTENNIGVVNRELGRLADAEQSFRRVIRLAPTLAFGHYNLGHALFLQGRYQAALASYLEGQGRDPERNPVQATRLAMCRLATGDVDGSLSELQRATANLPRDYRRSLIADTQSVAWALLTHRPDLPGWRRVSDWLERELAR